MKSLKFVHITGLTLFVAYMLLAGILTQAHGQYAPKTLQRIETRSAAVALSVNLGYAGYLFAKPYVAIPTQRWLNPAMLGVTMSVTFVEAGKVAIARRKLLKNMRIENHMVK